MGLAGCCQAPLPPLFLYDVIGHGQDPRELVTVQSTCHVPQEGFAYHAGQLSHLCS